MKNQGQSGDLMLRALVALMILACLGMGYGVLKTMSPDGPIQPASQATPIAERAAECTPGGDPKCPVGKTCRNEECVSIDASGPVICIEGQVRSTKCECLPPLFWGGSGSVAPCVREPVQCQDPDVLALLSKMRHQCDGKSLDHCPLPRFDDIKVEEKYVEEVMAKFPDRLVLLFPTGYPRKGQPWPSDEVRGRYRNALRTFLERNRGAYYFFPIGRASAIGRTDKNRELAVQRLSTTTAWMQLDGVAPDIAARTYPIVIGDARPISANQFRPFLRDFEVWDDVEKELVQRAIGASTLPGQKELELAELYINQSVTLVAIPCNWQ